MRSKSTKSRGAMPTDTTIRLYHSCCQAFPSFKRRLLTPVGSEVVSQDRATVNGGGLTQTRLTVIGTSPEGGG